MGDGMEDGDMTRLKLSFNLLMLAVACLLGAVWALFSPDFVSWAWLDALEKTARPLFEKEDR